MRGETTNVVSPLSHLLWRLLRELKDARHRSQARLDFGPLHDEIAQCFGERGDLDDGEADQAGAHARPQSNGRADDKELQRRHDEREDEEKPALDTEEQVQRLLGFVQDLYAFPNVCLGPPESPDGSETVNSVEKQRYYRGFHFDPALKILVFEQTVNQSDDQLKKSQLPRRAQIKQLQGVQDTTENWHGNGDIRHSRDCDTNTRKGLKKFYRGVISHQNNCDHVHGGLPSRARMMVKGSCQSSNRIS